MKMTNFFKMALMGIFAAGVFTACGGDDDNPNPNPNPGGGDDPKTAPTITLTGAQTSGSESSSLTFKLTLKNAESAKYLTVPTSELNNALNSATLEELVQSEGNALTSSQLQNALGQGLDLVFTQLEPNTEYTCAVYAVNGTESAVKSATATTANGGGGGVTPGTGSDAYNAWIGTWNVTSTSSLIGSDPMSFTVSIAEHVIKNVFGAFLGQIRQDAFQFFYCSLHVSFVNEFFQSFNLFHFVLIKDFILQR